jgi:thioredoxin-related protein
MKYSILSLTSLFILLAFNFKKNTPLMVQEEDQITWMSIEQAEEACKKKPKKIFIDVYTDWCGWCKKMDKSTFMDPSVVKYVKEEFYAVKLDAEDKNNIIFKNKVFKHNDQQKANELAVLFLNGEMSYPSIVYLDEKLNVIQTMGGYVDGNQFNMVLHYFGQNAYKKKKSLEEFKKDFKAEM